MHEQYFSTTAACISMQTKIIELLPDEFDVSLMSTAEDRFFIVGRLQAAT